MAKNTESIVLAASRGRCPTRLLPLIGRRFDRLTVCAYYGAVRYGLKNLTRYFACQCDCGNAKLVASSHLKCGNTKSCGCLHAELTAAASITHMHSLNRRTSPTYSSWAGMIQRCHNPKCAKYPDYGGRGIEVCAKWRDSFREFLRDMGERPKGMSIDRIDNDGNYGPENCRWADTRTQMMNRRVSRNVTVNGKLMSVCEAEKILGFKKDGLGRRIRMGIPAEAAMEIPFGVGPYRFRELYQQWQQSHEGEMRS